MIFTLDYFTAVTKSIQKKTKKPLYLYVGRLEWECDLDVEGKTAKNDAALLKKFLDGFDNQVAGIILRSITVSGTNYLL